MEKEKFLTAVFMTIVSFVCSFFGDMILVSLQMVV